MFEHRKLYVAKKFNVSTDVIERSAGRMQGYLIKQGLSVRNIIFALGFLIDTIEEETEKDVKDKLYYHLKNPKHREKETEIINLYMQGFGSQRISKILKIPKSTIERFIKNNNIIRGDNG